MDARRYIGIDNGLDGAIAALDAGGRIVVATTMPTFSNGKGREIDICGVHDFLKRFIDPTQLCIVLEEASKHSPGKMALCSTWFTYGHLLALMKLTKLRHEIVRPQAWQKTFWAKPKMPKGKKFDTKAAALEAARKLWPTDTFLASERCTVPHDGIVDALLMAEWARRQNL